VVFAEPDPDTLELGVAAVEAVLTDDTDWVAVTAASNACGTVPQLTEIIRSAHAAGARVYVDAVHAAPHFPLDVAELGCDALACSAYKWFGPHVGVLWACPEIHEELRPAKLRPSSDAWPDRWELGTLPFESLAGVAAAAEYVHGMDWSVVQDHERGMLRIALAGLAEIEGVRLHGDAARRAPTLMFSVEGRDPTELAISLAARQVAVWHGNYYAYELERTLGLAPDGAIRAGFLHYNTAAEAERFVETVREVVEAA